MKEKEMLVTGYKSTADFDGAAKSIAKHADVKLSQASFFLDKLKTEGLTFSVKDDFVLREDLENFKFTIM